MEHIEIICLNHIVKICIVSDTLYTRVWPFPDYLHDRKNFIRIFPRNSVFDNLNVMIFNIITLFQFLSFNS